MLCLHNTKIFDGTSFHENKTIWILQGKIKDIGSASSKEKPFSHKLDLSEYFVTPGFIDLQVNGGGGIFLNKNFTLKSLKTVMATHLQFGTTSFLPTFITDEKSKMLNALCVTQKALNQKMCGILGLHFEGPFLNKDKKGIHCVEHIREPTLEEIQKMCTLKNGVLLVTLAPEKVSHDFIQYFVKHGVLVFAGHTQASALQMREAFCAGVKGVTHLFNACSPFTSREPGVVGAALLHDHSWCSVIADGYHVDFLTLRLAFKAKSTKHFILISDAMPLLGTKMKSYFIQKKRIHLQKGRCVDLQGTLAGSAVSLYQGVLNLVQNKIVRLEEALAMASLHAAQCLGIDGSQKSDVRKGRISPGFDADLVVLRKTDLRIKYVIQNGIICYQE
jgi:N-acetylglucosamine-6-phosphate deacetylase